MAQMGTPKALKRSDTAWPCNGQTGEVAGPGLELTYSGGFAWLLCGPLRHRPLLVKKTSIWTRDEGRAVCTERASRLDARVRSVEDAGRD